jgi:hypothetical protein
MLVVVPVFQFANSRACCLLSGACQAPVTGVFDREKLCGQAAGAKQDAKPLQTVTIAFFAF